jgi:glycosyltransferase involved in cell wall biosynthesis
MKILRFCLKTPPLIGGMEAHILHLTKSQLERGHDVTVVFNSGDKISDHDIKFSRFEWFKLKPQFLGVFLFGFIVIMYFLCNKKKFDIVHVHGDWSSILIGQSMVYLGIASRSAITFHGGVQNTFSHRFILPFFIKKIKLVFSTGYNSYLYLKKFNTNVYFQPSGVNSIFFERIKVKREKKYDVISVANFSTVKNHKFILDIAEILKNNTFLLVGTGALLSRIQTDIELRGLQNIKCLGFKEINEIKKLMEDSKIFLLTSLEEGTPTSLMEAMATGLPVITSDVGGISKFISEKNGFIMNEFNSSLYADKINELLINHNLYIAINKENHSFSERFKWSSVEENISSKYV